MFKVEKSQTVSRFIHIPYSISKAFLEPNVKEKKAFLQPNIKEKKTFEIFERNKETQKNYKRNNLSNFRLKLSKTKNKREKKKKLELK